MSGHATGVDSNTIAFDANEATFSGIDVSPDGRSLLFDLLGHLYTVPVAGGRASSLAAGKGFDRDARYSPDGHWVAFVSDRGGSWNVWRVPLNAGLPQPVTNDSFADAQSPSWDASTDAIIYQRRATRGADRRSLLLSSTDAAGRTDTIVSDASGNNATSPDGRFVYYGPDAGGLARFDRKTGSTEFLIQPQTGCGLSPALSPDGNTIVHGCRRGGTIDLHLLRVASHSDQMLLASVRDDVPQSLGAAAALPRGAFAPDGRTFYTMASGQILRIEAATGNKTVVPFLAQVRYRIPLPSRRRKRTGNSPVVQRALQWPSFSSDRRLSAFVAASRVYVVDAHTQRVRFVSRNSAGTVALTPSFSPDSKQLVYISWTPDRRAQLRVVDLHTWRDRVIVDDTARFANPAWSVDGRQLIYIRSSNVDVPVNASGRAPRLSQRVAWIDIATNAVGGFDVLDLADRRARWMFARPRFEPQLSHVSLTMAAVRGMSIYRMAVDGSDRKLVIHATDADDAAVSPDGRHVAFVRRDGIVIAQLDSQGTNRTISIASTRPGVLWADRRGGAFVSWIDDDAVSWCAAATCYLKRLSSSGPIDSTELRLATVNPAPHGVTALVGVRAITMRGNEVIPNAAIVIDRNRFLAVGPMASTPIPTDARVIRLPGMTVIPGLIDTHAHIYDDAPDYADSRRRRYVAYLSHGVTTTFDPQASSLSSFALEAAIEAGGILGPRAFSSGDPLYGGDRYELAFPSVAVLLNEPRDAIEPIQHLAALGALMIKVYHQPRRQHRQWIAAAAREAGIPLTAEGGCDFDLDLTLVIDGYDAFEHGLPQRLKQDVLELLARSGVVYTPTLNVGCGGDGAEAYYNSPSTRPRTGNSGGQFRIIASGAAELLRRGGHVTTGSHGDTPGTGMLTELRALTLGGMTPQEALSCATIEAARKLGLQEDLGSLAPEKLADLLVLKADPVKGLAALDDPVLVVKDGVVYDAHSLSRYGVASDSAPRTFDEEVAAGRSDDLGYLRY